METKQIKILIIFTAVAAAVFSICSPQYSNYTPLVFAIWFLYLGFRYVSLGFEASIYIQRNHPDFYEKYKSTFNDTISLLLIPTYLVKRLRDDKVMMLRNEALQLISLLLICMGIIFLLAIYSVYD